MFKIKEASPEEKSNMILKLKKAIDALAFTVPQVKYMQTGININKKPQAFDLLLLSDFESEEALEIYREHPEHKKVIEIIKDCVDKVNVVDYKL